MTQRYSERDAEIERFKTRFETDLSSFIKNRHDMLGKKSQWKLVQIKLMSQTPTIAFGGGKKQCSFMLHELPEDLTKDEAFSLRQYINEECNSRGFQHYNPRRSYKFKNVEGVVRRDPEAVAAWISHYRPTLLNKAAQGMSDLGVDSNATPEDVLSEAVIGFLNNPHPSEKPSADMGKNIMWAVSDLTRGKWRIESDSPLVDKRLGSYVQRHTPGKPAELSQEKLSQLLIETGKLLSPIQRQILDIIQDHHKQQLAQPEQSSKYAMLTLEQIATKLPTAKQGPPYTRKDVQYLIHGNSNSTRTGIAYKIKKAAATMAEKDPEMVEVAEYLVNLLNHGTQIQRRSAR